MISNFSNLYKASSNNLICALKEAIKLIEIKEEIFQIDSAIFDEIKKTKQDNSVKTASLYKRKMDMLRIVDETKSSMNNYIESSIIDLMSMLEEAFANPSLVDEITICQNQMKSICNFINKEYLKEYIKLNSMKHTLLLFILKYNEKRILPQYENILNQIMELYNVASRT